jgi:hypothetical protein
MDIRWKFVSLSPTRTNDHFSASESLLPINHKINTHVECFPIMYIKILLNMIHIIQSDWLIIEVWIFSIFFAVSISVYISCLSTHTQIRPTLCNYLKTTNVCVHLLLNATFMSLKVDTA